MDGDLTWRSPPFSAGLCVSNARWRPASLLALNVRTPYAAIVGRIPSRAKPRWEPSAHTGPVSVTAGFDILSRFVYKTPEEATS